MSPSREVALHRMELDEVCEDPVATARRIHELVPSDKPAVDIVAIAQALDIYEIRYEAFDNCAGALVTEPSRRVGSIAVDKAMPRRRQRFTIAHELGHFLNPAHVMTSEAGFTCTKQDMARFEPSKISDDNRQVVQEIEANRFAIELLAPAERFSQYLRHTPDLALVETIAAQCEVSREAIARRYVELSIRPIAIIFSQADAIRSIARHPKFPFVRLKIGEHIPPLKPAKSGVRITDHEKTDAANWDIRSGSPFAMQTMWQQDGYAMTLLIEEDDA